MQNFLPQFGKKQPILLIIQFQCPIFLKKSLTSRANWKLSDFKQIWTIFEQILSNFEQVKAILSYFEPFWAILSHFKQILSHVEPCGATWSHFEAFWSIWNHFEPFWTNLNKFEQIWAILSRFEPWGAMWSHAEPCGAIWNHLEPFETTWNRIEPLGPNRIKITLLLLVIAFFHYLFLAPWPSITLQVQDLNQNSSQLKLMLLTRFIYKK